MRLRPFTTYDALVEAADGDPYIRYAVHPQRELKGFSSDGAVAWAAIHPHRGLGWMGSLGPIDDVAPLVVAAIEQLDEKPYGLTVPRGTRELLPLGARTAEANDWDWWWIDAPPPVQPGEETVAWLDNADEEIAKLLQVASPDASTWPGDPGVIRWCGVRSGDGALVATAAWTEHVPGVPHLASVATAPSARGRGVGGAVTAWVTRQAFDAGAPAVTLGMYAVNDPARRVYRRLGFRDDHHFTSGLFALPPTDRFG